MSYVMIDINYNWFNSQHLLCTNGINAKIIDISIKNNESFIHIISILYYIIINKK